MRLHFSSAVTIFVTLLFVSGTVGCRSNGGPWYNPKSYTWTSPLTKNTEAPLYSSGAQASTKPSLDSHPNISTPQGGYSDESNFQTNRAGSYGGTTGGYSSGQDMSQSQTASSQSPPNMYNTYSVAEPSPYPPTYTEGQLAATNGTAPAPYHQQQYQYPAETIQYSDQTPYSATGSPVAYPTSAYEYQAGSAVINYSQAPNYGTVDNYGSVNPSMTSGNYAPSVATNQNDPYTMMQQQPTSASPIGYGYDQLSPTPSPYTGGGVPVASPYQPYQPSGGYNY